jgi:hypothetical protein
MLEYCLESNELTANPNDRRAKTVNVVSRSQEAVIDRILQIGAGLTRSDVLSVLEAEKQVISAMLADGEAVTTDLFNAFPGIQGVFTGAEDSFDPKRHRVKIHLTEGAGLRNVESQVKTKKVLPGPTGAYITSVMDVKSGSESNLLTPKGPLRIYGSKLKVSGDDPAVGIFFKAADGAEVKVSPVDLVENKPSEVIVLIPDLAPGQWTIRLGTQFSGSSTESKKPHSTEFAAVLTVQ